MSQFLFLVFSLWLVAAPGHSAESLTQPEKISPQLLTKIHSCASHKADVLVQFPSVKDWSEAEHFTNRTERVNFVRNRLLAAAEQSQADAVQVLRANSSSFQSFYIANFLYVPQASEALLRKLAALPQVEYIRENSVSTLQLPPLDSSPVLPQANDIPANISAINADRVWSELGVKGADIVVGVQDTGFSWKHEALKRQYRGYNGTWINHEYNWHDSIHSGTTANAACPANSPEPCDDRGHGTHVLGSIVGDDLQGNRIGVAPGARWIGCRNMLAGTGTAASYLECFEFFLAPYPRGGNSRTDGRADMAPHIISNSWACTKEENCNGSEFLEPVRALKAAGIFVVAAAGNEGPGCGSVGDAPGTYGNDLLSVAAYDHRDGTIASFSSRGPSAWNQVLVPHIAAPGTMIRSSVPGGRDNEYDYKQGTSMATPHVAGVIALLWSARPNLVGKIAETTQILERTATPKTSSQTCGPFNGNAIPNAVFGYGLINAYKAIQEARWQ